MSNPKIVHVGVVGCGWIMRSMYTPTLLSLADRVRVTAVCDLNEEAARASAGQFENAAVFTDVRAMLRDAQLDAVLVLTTEKVNATMARLVLEAGLPVYLEKPPAVSSAELEKLIDAEARSKTFIYTAFNRRHTPLFAGLDLAGGKLRRISGALRRTDRAVATFPHTSIHLIDSAQHFAGSRLQSWTINFKTKPENSIWTIDGKLENGAELGLQFIPNGSEFAEYLILETTSGTWELQFPNTAAAVPEGEMIESPADGAPSRTIRGDATLAPIESMGFRPCFLDFIRELEKSKASSLHRLPFCRPTIRVIEDMEACLKASSGEVTGRTD